MYRKTFKKMMSLVTLSLFVFFTISCTTTRVVLDGVDVLQRPKPPHRILALYDTSGKWIDFVDKKAVTVTPAGIEGYIVIKGDTPATDRVEKITIPIENIKWLQFNTTPKLTAMSIITPALGLLFLIGKALGGHH